MTKTRAYAVCEKSLAKVANKYSFSDFLRVGKCETMNDGRYRFLTERECWRLNGYSDYDYENAEKENPKRNGARFNRTLYKQAGNSIVVNVLEALFRNLLL